MSNENKIGKRILKMKAFWIALTIIFAVLLGLIVKYLIVDNSNVLTTEEKIIKEQLDCTNEEAIRVTSQIKEVFDIQIKNATLYEDYLVFNKTEDGEFKAYLVKDDKGLWDADIITYVGGEELGDSVRVKETSDTLFNEENHEDVIVAEDNKEDKMEDQVDVGTFNGLENDTAIIIKGSVHRVYNYDKGLKEKLESLSVGDVIKFKADYFEDGSAKILEILNQNDNDHLDNIKE